jgi:hypothetical protein
MLFWEIPMKKRRVATTLIALLAAAPLLVGSSPADAGGKNVPAATVAPGTVWPKAEPCATGTGVHDFTVSGAGFQPDELVTVTVGAVAYEPTRADSTGAYSAGYEIRSLRAGAYRVDVKGDRGGRAQGKITVGYSACRSSRDGSVRVTGAGFGGTETIAVHLDGGTTTAITATSTEDGAFDLQTTCPVGPHTLDVADTHDNVLHFAEFTC